MERPIIKDEKAKAYISFLEHRLDNYEKSPYLKSYLSLLFQINHWNEQLNENPINIFADKEAKEFDRAHKYFTEQRPYFEQLDYLRKLMNPDDEKAISEKLKYANLPLAEKMALNNK